MALTLVGVILSPTIGAVTDAGPDALPMFVGLLFETWFRTLIAGAAAVLTGTAVTAVTLDRRREGPARRGGRLGFEAVLAAGAFPVLLLAGDRSWGFALGAAVLLVALELAAHLTRMPPALVGLLGSGPWLAFAADQVWGDGIAGEDFSWIAVIAVGSAAISVLGFYGFTRAADSRIRVLKLLYRDDLPRGAVLAVVLVMTVLVALRITVFPDLFENAGSSALWRPFERRSPISWGLAAGLAAFVIALALRSSRRPFRRHGQRGVALTFSVLGNRDLLLVGAGILGYLALIAVIRDPDRAILGELFDGALAIAPEVALVALVGAGLVVLHPRFRGSAGRWYTLVSVAYLLPPTVALALDDAGVDLPTAVAGFPASPVQITVILLAAAVAFALVNLGLPAERRINPSAIVRMAVVPFVAFHIGRIVPELWAGSGRWLVAIGALAALLFFMPRVAADRQRHAVQVLRVSALQVFALTTFLIALSGFAGDLALLTVLWLSITIFAALTVDTADDPPPRGDLPSTPSEGSANIGRLPSDGRG